jgi:hypothetical protein
MVTGPGILPGTALPQLVGNVDIAPTIMELAAGHASVPHVVDGKSLVPYVHLRLLTVASECGLLKCACSVVVVTRCVLLTVASECGLLKCAGSVVVVIPHFSRRKIN